MNPDESLGDAIHLQLEKAKWTASRGLLWPGSVMEAVEYKWKAWHCPKNWL